MSFESVLLGIGIGILIFVLIMIAIQIVLFILLFRSIKKNPALWVMVLILLIIISTLEVLDPITIVEGIISWIAVVTAIVVNFRKIKKLIKKRK